MLRLLIPVGLILTLGGCAQLGQIPDKTEISRHDAQLEAAKHAKRAELPKADSLELAKQDSAIEDNKDGALKAANTDPANIDTDLWQHIRDGYRLSAIEHKRINKQEDWYGKHPNYMNRISKRARPYLYFIVNELKARDLPMELALLPIVESAYDPFAYSHGRASGLWQFTPPTAKDFGLHNNWWYDGRRDIEASTQAALDYLEKLHKRFDGDWLLALAAYNAGGGTVNKAIKRNRRQGKNTDFWSLRLPKETQIYVPRLLGLAKLVAEPEKYGIQMINIPDEPFYRRFDLDYQLDLAQAAELAELPMDEFYLLNPAYNRWATTPDGPQHILIPIAQADAFSSGLESLDESERVGWKRYQVKSGDTLGKIARQNNLTLGELKRINRLSSNTIRLGQALFIPTASKPGKHYSFSLNERVARNQGKGRVQRYKVRSGDSLWSISRKFGVNYEDIARWNKLSVNGTLKLGQKLVIYPKQANYAQGKKRISYKVRKGDSIARIAKKFGTSIKSIVRSNGLNPKDYLQPGQALTLLVDPRRG